MKISNRITRTALLLALAIAVQQLKIQWLTGPAINAILLLAVAYVDVYAAAAIGAATPVLALLNGIMPLAVAVPFIIMANMIYVMSFSWQFRKNMMVAVAFAAIMKYLVLAGAVGFIIEVPPRVAYALTTAQLFTAVTGGVIAMVIIRYLPLETAIQEKNHKE